MLKIFGKRLSRAARCLWVLEEMGLPYRQVPLDTQGGETRTREYLALNPAGKVPVIDDDGFVLRESLAINAYLVAQAATPLWPDDVRCRALINQWSSWATTEMEVPLNAMFRAKRRAAAAGVEVDAAFMAETLDVARQTLRLLEDHLAAHAYVASAAFTLGDINAYTAAMLMPMFQDLSAYPPFKNGWDDAVHGPHGSASPRCHERGIDATDDFNSLHFRGKINGLCKQ